MGNTATGTAPDGLGGGMYITGGVSALASTKFTGNLAEDYGGGLAYEYSCFHSTSSLLGIAAPIPAGLHSWCALPCPAVLCPALSTFVLITTAGKHSLVFWSDTCASSHALVAVSFCSSIVCTALGQQFRYMSVQTKALGSLV